MKLKRTISLFIVICLLLTGNTPMAYAVETLSVQNEKPEFVVQDGVLVKYNFKSENVNIPEGVTEISRFAFQGESEKITSITMPSSLRIIQSGAFSECENLTNLVLNNGLEVIEGFAFGESKLLKNVVIPDSVIEIESANAFPIETYGCDSDFLIINDNLLKYFGNEKEVEIPNGVKRISMMAFEHSLNVEKVKIPETVEYIGGWAFAWLKNLKEVELPENLYKIDHSAFLGTSWQDELLATSDFAVVSHVLLQVNSTLEDEEIVIPEGIMGIAGGAFYGCKAKKISMPDTVKFLGESTFAYSNIEKVNISNNVESIPYSCFNSCKSLKEVELSERITKINDYAFERCINLEKVVLGTNTREIGRGAFQECFMLQDIILSSTLEQIGRVAFKGCENITNLELPEALVLWERKHLGEQELLKLEFQVKLQCFQMVCLSSLNLKKYILTAIFLI